MEITVPLEERVAHGQVCPRPELKLNVRARVKHTQQVRYVGISFVVDTGSDISVIPMKRALEAGIPYEKIGEPVRTRLANGTELFGYVGKIYIQVSGAAEVHEWPCIFSTDPPDTPQGPTENAGQVRPAAKGGSRIRAVRKVQIPESADEWLEWSEDGTPPRKEELQERPLLLGRAGFLTDYSITIRDQSLIVTRAKRSARKPK